MFDFSNGETLVHLASRNRNLSMIKLLLDSNALPDLESELIGKAANLVELEEYPEIRKLLLSAENNNSTSRMRKYKSSGSPTKTTTSTIVSSSSSTEKVQSQHSQSVPCVSNIQNQQNIYVKKENPPPPSSSSTSSLSASCEEEKIHFNQKPNSIVHIKTERSSSAKTRPVSGSWTDFSVQLRETNGKRKPRPRSARGLRRDVLLKDFPKSSNDIYDPSSSGSSKKPHTSLPSTQLSIHLEKLNLLEKETISEETFLFEADPTPRTKARRERNRSSTSYTDYRNQNFTSSLNKVKREDSENVNDHVEVIKEEIPISESIPSSSDIQKNDKNQFPLQKQVVIPLLRESEEEHENETEDQVLLLEKQLTQFQAQAQQLRIELEMTKKLLTRARRKLKEKDRKIYLLEHGEEEL